MKTLLIVLALLIALPTLAVKAEEDLEKFDKAALIVVIKTQEKAIGDLQKQVRELKRQIRAMEKAEEEAEGKGPKIFDLEEEPDKPKADKKKDGPELETVFELNEITDKNRELRRSKSFDRGVEIQLSVSLGPSKKGATPFMRIRLYSVDDEGVQTELRKYRVTLEKPQKLITEKIKLDPGRYSFRVEVSMAEYLVKVQAPKQG